MPGNYKVKERSRVIEHINEAINQLHQALVLFMDILEQDTIVTCTQAAQQLGCTVQTISKYIREGKLTKSFDGMMYGIWQTELDAFMVSYKVRQKRAGRKLHESRLLSPEAKKKQNYMRKYYRKNKARIKEQRAEKKRRDVEELEKAKEDNAIIA